MVVDSAHSKIEKLQKNIDLHVPADYCNLVTSARKNPSPFKCNYLSYSFFKNNEEIQTRASVRPGYTKGDPNVSEVKEYRCDPSGDIFHKLSHDTSTGFTLLPQRNRKSISQLQDLYSGLIPISRRKLKDLQEINKVINPDYHSFYDNLPYSV